MLKISKQAKTPYFNTLECKFEVDEMWTYIKRKKDFTWITYVIERESKTVIDFFIGRKLKDNIKSLINKVVIFLKKTSSVLNFYFRFVQYLHYYFCMKLKQIMPIMFLLAAFFSKKSYCQIQLQNDKPEFEKVVYPSPTVQALDAFSEVPVNHYTGVPDINIPFFNVKTLNNKKALNLNLRYHPSNVKVEQIPGWEGLGWSLSGLGAIYKNINGIDDESYVDGGVYNANNPFDSEFFDYNENFISSTLGMNDEEIYDRNFFLYNAGVKHKFDTSYDLYNLNYGNLQAKFYVKKLNNNYLVKPLFLDQVLDINVLSDTYVNGKLYIKGFEIIDSNGFKYLFDEKEEVFISSETYSYTDVESRNIDHRSNVNAFWIRQIKGPNDNILISFDYDIIKEEYAKSNVSKYNAFQNFMNPWSDPKYNSPPRPGNSLPRPINRPLGLKPNMIANFLYYTVDSKKISHIDIKGVGDVYINSEVGRLDFKNPNEASKLSEIIIKNKDSVTIKKIKFNHSYRSQADRLVLNSIDFVNPAGQTEKSYSFFYKNIDQLPIFDSKEKDIWGYYNGPNLTNTPHTYTPNENFTDIGLLNKMIIPSGGAYVFDFESNAYAYVNDDLQEDFPNKNNEQLVSKKDTYIGYQDEGGQMKNIIYISNDQEVKFILKALSYNTSFPEDKAFWDFDIKPVIIDESQVNINNYLPGNFQLTQIDKDYLIDDLYNSATQNGRPSYRINAGDFQDYLNINNYIKTFLLRKGFYIIDFKTSDVNPIANNSVTYELEYDFYHHTNEYKYIPGGGNRIKSIGYFSDGNISSSFFEDRNNYPISNKPDIEINYDYQLFDAESTSSGSIISLPKANYYLNHNFLVKKTAPDGREFFNPYSVSYIVENDYNVLEGIQTQGNYVGYKNVKVNKIEANVTIENFFDIIIEKYENGESRYTYSSPMDIPFTRDSDFPFVEQPYPHYRNGNLLKVSNFDAKGKLLKVKITFIIMKKIKEFMVLKLFCPMEDAHGFF